MLTIVAKIRAASLDKLCLAFLRCTLALPSARCSSRRARGAFPPPSHCLSVRCRARFAIVPGEHGYVFTIIIEDTLVHTGCDIKMQVNDEGGRTLFGVSAAVFAGEPAET